MKNSFGRFLDKFRNLNGAKFISINNYLSVSTHEIANFILNVNISIENAKKTDYERLMNCNKKDLKTISLSSGIAIDILTQSLAEMLTSAEKNLSPDLKDRTAQSQGQTNAFVTLAPGVKLHTDTLEVHIFGQLIKKELVQVGDNYKPLPNSSDKTLGKKAITEHLDLRAGKYRTFVLGNADSLQVTGETIEIVR
jgi:vancomycin resistance protein YoaR